ncbi:hypothetical protein [Pedobacter sp. B4-66]|uniref:hypothetical protein n=1 Tax=Pedobacter sp. B4-66 TaxID=2817280 RepID=UPI001BDA88FC|nr:hypothetical protein [Pedobacter sp. B4-66]
MKRLLEIICLIIFFAMYGCSGESVDRNYTKTIYRAISKGDTATFKINLTDKEFFGQLEINYNGLYKDSGDVTGIVKGNELKGTYRFQHYGVEAWHKTPIALLKKDGKLIMGEGSMEVYMNIHYFKKNKPINYQNVKFVFEKMP